MFCWPRFFKIFKNVLKIENFKNIYQADLRHIDLEDFNNRRGHLATKVSHFIF